MLIATTEKATKLVYASITGILFMFFFQGFKTNFGAILIFPYSGCIFIVFLMFLWYLLITETKLLGTTAKT